MLLFISQTESGDQIISHNLKRGLVNINANKKGIILSEAHYFCFLTINSALGLFYQHLRTGVFLQSRYVKQRQQHQQCHTGEGDMNIALRDFAMFLPQHRCA